jgi:geranylgeranyl diphosphate synthase type II
MTPAFLPEKLALVDGFLEKHLPPPDLVPEVLHQAMRYAVMAGGKRIRPILCLIVAEDLGRCIDTACLRTASALELLHTYSLVHDDLPAMDNDDFRRGRPTTHKAFGEGPAILVGDALLTLAFQWLGDSRTEGNSSEQVGELVRLLSLAAGNRGMIGGQMLDLAAEGKHIELSQLQRIHEWKTGALLAAAVEMGAILGHLADPERSKLRRFGEILGLLFQITDDILDVEGDFHTLGKPIGSDQSKGKATYPALMGMTEAKRLAQQTADEALAILKSLPHAVPRLSEAVDFVLRRTH